MKKLKSSAKVFQPKSTAKQIQPKPVDSWRNSGSANSRGYTYKWQKAREVFLFSNPLCVYCEKIGKVTVANVVDHIIPHKGDQKLFWDQKNWQPLCKYCHDNIKSKEEREMGY